MKLRKLSIVLLAFLLAAMAMVPCVGAEEKKLNEQKDLTATKNIVSPDHHIPPEYFKDSPHLLTSPGLLNFSSIQAR